MRHRFTLSTAELSPSRILKVAMCKDCGFHIAAERSEILEEEMRISAGCTSATFMIDQLDSLLKAKL